MILRSEKYSALPKSGAHFLQNIALSALAGGNLIFWRFHGFEKQLPQFVHVFSQFGGIFGVHAVGAVDSLANLIYQ